MFKLLCLLLLGVLVAQICARPDDKDKAKEADKVKGAAKDIADKAKDGVDKADKDAKGVADKAVKDAKGVADKAAKDAKADAEGVKDAAEGLEDKFSGKHKHVADDDDDAEKECEPKPRHHKPPHHKTNLIDDYVIDPAEKVVEAGFGIAKGIAGLFSF